MLKKAHFKFKRIHLILIFILGLAFLFRFYALSEFFHFGMDLEYEAFLVRNIVNGIHFPLIGVNASDTGLYLGPYFIYLSVIPFVLFAGNPLGFAVTASFLGVLTTFLIYYFVAKVINSQVAMLSAFFYASSFLASFYDRNYWNPSLIPLLSLLMGFLIFRIYKKKYGDLLFLSFAFGMSLHTHLSLLIFAPLIIIVLVKNFRNFGKKILIWSLIIFLSMVLPLILFDLRHNFTNSKALLNLSALKTPNTDNVSVGYKAQAFINFVGRFFWLPQNPDLFVEKGLCKNLQPFQKKAYPEIIGIMLLFLVIFLIVNYKSRNKSSSVFLRQIMGLFLLSLLVIVFYNGNISEYYFNYLLPYLAIILGLVTSLLWQDLHSRPAVFFIIPMFLILNLSTLFTAESSYSYNQKLKVIDYSKQFTSKGKFSLEAIGDCARFGGWRYLFEYFAAAPKNSYMDSYLGWLYDYDDNSKGLDNVIFLSLIDQRSGIYADDLREDKIKFLNNYAIEAKKNFGKIDAYLLKIKK